MTIISKYVALKNYIPTGLPKEDDFEIKSKTLELDETNNIHVLNGPSGQKSHALIKKSVYLR